MTTPQDGQSMREESQERRAANRAAAVAALNKSGVRWSTNNAGVHIMIEGPQGRVDYWPGTGLWRTAQGQEGRGIRSLFAHLKLKLEF